MDTTPTASRSRSRLSQADHRLHRGRNRSAIYAMTHVQSVARLSSLPLVVIS